MTAWKIKGLPEPKELKIRVGEKYELERRFDTPWWDMVEQERKLQGGHHLPSGCIVRVKELKEVDGTSMVHWVLLRDNNKSWKAFACCTQDVFSSWFKEIAEGEE